MLNLSHHNLEVRACLKISPPKKEFVQKKIQFFYCYAATIRVESSMNLIIQIYWKQLFRQNQSVRVYAVSTKIMNGFVLKRLKLCIIIIMIKNWPHEQTLWVAYKLNWNKIMFLIFIYSACFAVALISRLFVATNAFDFFTRFCTKMRVIQIFKI